MPAAATVGRPGRLGRAFSRVLVAVGLIDGFHVWRFPVIAGASDSRFDGLPVTHLEVDYVTTFASGIAVEVYRNRAGGRARGA